MEVAGPELSLCSFLAVDGALFRAWAAPSPRCSLLLRMFLRSCFAVASARFVVPVGAADAFTGRLDRDRILFDLGDVQLQILSFFFVSRSMARRRLFSAGSISAQAMPVAPARPVRQYDVHSSLVREAVHN